MNIKVRKRTGTIDIQKELRKTEKHPLFNVVVPDTTTINLSGRSSLKKNKRDRILARFNKKLAKFLLFLFGLLFISGFLIVATHFSSASAKGKTICNSQKCEARIERIKVCEKKHTEKKDIVLCAMIKTVKTKQGEMIVTDFRETRQELENLYDLYKNNTGDFFSKLKEFVKKGEGSFQEKAFCDSYYKSNKGLIRHPAHLCTRWSIGYGTISYQGEKITLEEGLKRKAEDLQKRNALITSDCLSDNQRIAVVDFMYQHGANSSGIVKKANSCDINGIYGVFVNWRDVYKNKKQSGMVKREQMRINLFNNN